jgi:hypothetical protein
MEKKKAALLSYPMYTLLMNFPLFQFEGNLFKARIRRYTRRV